MRLSKLRATLVLTSLCCLSAPASAWCSKIEDREILFRELRSSLKSAENALARDELEEASSILEHLLDIGRDVGFDQRTFMELSVRLAETYTMRERFEDAAAVVGDLLDMAPPDDLFLRLSVLRGRIYEGQGDIVAGYATLADLDEYIPSLEWPTEDRAYFEEMTETLNRRWEDLILQAERLFAKGLYDESIQVFTEVVTGVNRGLYPGAMPDAPRGKEIVAKVRHRLAEGYFATGNFGGTVTVLSNINPRLYTEAADLQTLYVSDLFLLGSAARHTGDLLQAESSLQAYLSYRDSMELARHDEAWLELAQAYVDAKRPVDARAAFDHLGEVAQEPRYRHLSHMHKAHLDLDAGNYAGVVEEMNRLLQQLEADDPLAYEAQYLKGEAAYQVGDLEAAALAYRAALPKNDQVEADWSAKVRYSLGWALRELGDQAENGSPEQMGLYAQAEETFHQLLEASPDPKVYLALARGYLNRGLKLKEDEALDRVEELLADADVFLDVSDRAQALVLRAEAARSYEKREEIFRELTGDRYVVSEVYGESWLGRGLNHYRQGQEYLKRQQRTQADACFNEAIACLYSAFDALKDQHRVLAGDALRYQVQAYFHLGSYEGKFMAFSLIENLLERHRSVFTAMRNQDELLYYRGLTASHLMPYGEEERFAEVAIESLQEVVDHWREGSFAPDALYTLGMVHFKKGNYVEAEHLFTQLAASYPYFDKVGESWFWAAESAEWTQRDPLLVKRYRRTVFEGYPNTEHAPHAYFNYFSYADYLQGQGTAMAHLAKMKDIYPDTPYLIVVNYLQGLDLKGEQWDPDGVLLHTADISAATTAFEEARQQFDFCYEHGLIESKRLDYFVNVRYRSMLEKARGFTQVAQEAEGAKRQIYLQYAEQAYREIVADFSEDPSPLVAFVHEDVPGLGVREDAEYGLAEVYKAAGDLPAAQATVDSMLQRLKGEEQLSPYFAATVYRLSAELASLRGQPAEALDALDRAEELAGTDALPSDERLEMGILKARCYKDLGDLPRAMQLLGQVVEAEVPSPVRVQAMLERSEIYRAEGKRDLAIRQLEIAAETGGEWAERARETLDKDYALYR